MLPSTAAVLSNGGRQSFPDLFSSCSKQPIVGSLPPSNLAVALARQPLKFGSFGLPIVSAFWWHLRMLFSFLAAHFFLPTPHLLWSIEPGSIAATISAAHASTSISTDAVSSRVTKSFGFCFSSLSKQPFVGSLPPANLPVALS